MLVKPEHIELTPSVLDTLDLQAISYDEENNEIPITIKNINQKIEDKRVIYATALTILSLQKNYVPAFKEKRTVGMYYNELEGYPNQG